jgi:putative flippase GtrA
MTPVEPLQPVANGEQSLARHGAGFVTSGLIALAVDTGMTSLLTRAFGVPPLLARPIAIAVAMVVAWTCHRHLTFAVKTEPSLNEFGRYAAVAWGAAGVNYAIYAAILFLLPVVAPELALIASSVVSMVVSYLGMRFGVFKR